MSDRIKSKFLVCATALGMIAAIHSHTAYAQDSLVLGGQICQPATNTTAGINWSGGGTFNGSDGIQSVVCPLVHSKLFNQIGATARVVNRSSSAQDLTCQFRISGPAGLTALEEELTLPAVQPGQVALFGFANYPILDTQTAAIICELPPETGVTGITVDLTE